jgi:hypothetical protein
MKNISEAFVNFQSDLKPIGFDSENPFFKSNYLSLSGILENVLPILTKHKLSISQPMRVDNGIVIISTVLRHSSGEALQSDMILPPISDVQKFGSLITYYKRYQLQAMLGISTRDEDDDANTLVPEKAGNRSFQAQNSISNVNTNTQTKPTGAAITPASDAQKNALKRMGIAFQDNISKSEASKLIEQANKR